MVKLLSSDIQTKEVLEWTGVHLLHAAISSCSQKTRIFLNLKGIKWESHLIDIGSGENHLPWFLGINPRGLVPILVHDGNVHIESNDIMLYLERTFPEPSLLIKDTSHLAQELLNLEDDMHMDLRTLSFRYVAPIGKDFVKNPEALERLSLHNGTIDGKEDQHKYVEIAFWEEANKNHGITDEQVRVAATNFYDAFMRLEEQLEKNAFVVGEAPSVVDIAWFVYANRVRLAGYPLSLHPNLLKWFEKLSSMDAFKKEIALPSAAIERIQKQQLLQAENGDTMAKIAGFPSSK